MGGCRKKRNMSGKWTPGSGRNMYTIGVSGSMKSDIMEMLLLEYYNKLNNSYNIITQLMTLFEENINSFVETYDIDQSLQLINNITNIKNEYLQYTEISSRIFEEPANYLKSLLINFNNLYLKSKECNNLDYTMEECDRAWNILKNRELLEEYIKAQYPSNRFVLMRVESSLETRIKIKEPYNTYNICYGAPSRMNYDLELLNEISNTYDIHNQWICPISP